MTLRDWLKCALALCALFAASAAHAERQRLAAEPEGDIVFVTPSGNIGCHYIPAGGTSTYETADGGAELQCDRVAPRYVAVVLSQNGKARRIDLPGEQGCCSIEQKLHYGRSWSAGPFTCLSEKNGLSCSSLSGHGFFISRAKITVH